MSVILAAVIVWRAYSSMVLLHRQLLSFSNLESTALPSQIKLTVSLGQYHKEGTGSEGF